MAGSFLKKLGKAKKAEVEKAKKRVSQTALLEKMLALPPVRNFREVLFRIPRLGVIAEYKKKVPGKRDWKPRGSLENRIALYEEGEALALSVVTEEKNFGGKLGLVGEVKALTSLPVLCKDFIVDPYQIYEARVARADALLLIAELLPDKLLARCVEVTSSLGMTPVVEVHAAPDLKRAMKAGADVLLINNRDLNTLKVNMQTVPRLAKLVPRDITLIAASGYSNLEDVLAIPLDRVRAVLMGRVLLEHKTPDQFMRAVVDQAEKYVRR